MMSVIQRVRSASVQVADTTVASMGPGLLVLLCAERGDTPAQGEQLLRKLLKLRIFSDATGKMNHSVQNLDGQGTPGGLLIVSQFTLAADTSSGTRPSFTPAAPPDQARQLYDLWVAAAQQAHPLVQAGIFGADMQVHLVNDGPVTLPVRVPPPA